MHGFRGIRAIRRTRRRPAVIASVGIIIILTSAGLGATPAAADTVAVAYTNDGASTVYYAAGGTHSDARITMGTDGRTQFVIDDIVPISVGEGCVHPDASDTTYVLCTLTEYGNFWTRVVVELGEGNDSLWMRGGDENVVHSGRGHDNLDVSLNTVVYGEEGDDYMVGGGLAYGGSGDDILSGPRNEPDLDNSFLAYGEDGDDGLYGGSEDDVLYGGRGHDTIEGRGDNDRAYGNSGRDYILGGTGADRLYGGPDNDTIYGNSGNDYVRGDGGADTLSGGPGTDTVIQGS
jgi:serralysin